MYNGRVIFGMDMWQHGKHIQPFIGENAKSRDPNEIFEPLSRLVYMSISVAKSTAECASMEISILFALQQQNSMNIYAKKFDEVSTSY